MRNVQAHYIRANEDTRVPKRLVVFDTEANRGFEGRKERQSWSLGVARFIWWTNKGAIHQSQSRFETPTELWLAISQFTRAKQRTVVYAHNLTYDMRISQTMTILSSMKWTMVDMRLDSRGSWSKWGKEGNFLTLCDSASIWPVPLAEVAKALQMRKPPLPKCEEREALFSRCEADVDILSTALLAYFDWLRSGECGNWAMTGASQSWNHWRHSHYTHKVLVHDNSDALEAERRAMWTGRVEAYRWGNIFGERLYDYDYENSYARIARDVSVPTRYRGHIGTPTVEGIRKLSKRYAVLADITVRTKEPILPAKHDSKIVWPIGTFRTTVWDPELRLAWEDDCIVKVHRAWLYTKQPALRQWGQYILESLHDRSGVVEPWKKIILKHWSRSLIGRFGMRYTSWEKFATANSSDVRVWQCGGDMAPAGGHLMQIGDQVYAQTERQEVRDGCPQITGYIMSEARAKLWRVMAALPAGSVFYVDTDSLIVDQTGHRHILSANGLGDYGGLRSKGSYNQVEIYGPRSIILGNKPRISGLPKRAVRQGKGHFYGEVWQSLERAIQVGNLGTVHIDPRVFRVKWLDSRRVRLSDGRTRPYHIGLSASASGIPIPEVTPRQASVLASAGIRRKLGRASNTDAARTHAQNGTQGARAATQTELEIAEREEVMPIDTTTKY